MDLTAQRRDWEDLSRVDPLWAVLSDPSKRYGRWEPEEFFAVGERDVVDFLEASERHGLPAQRSAALDFGCGAGRITRALSTRFERSVGVDISEPMIELARDLNQDRPGCEFVVNVRDDLSLFEDQSFDFVVTHLVLQHMPGTETALRYVGELARVLRPGGALLLQAPSSIPMPYRPQLGRRLYVVLRRLGVSAETLYRRLRLQPMRMTAVPVEAVRRRLEEMGLRVLEARSERIGVVTSTEYLATR